MFCTKCGAELKENQKFCVTCGAKAPIRTAPGPPTEETQPSTLAVTPTPPTPTASSASPRPNPPQLPAQEQPTAPQPSGEEASTRAASTPAGAPTRTKSNLRWIWVSATVILVASGGYFAYHHWSGRSAPKPVTVSTGPGPSAPPSSHGGVGGQGQASNVSGTGWQSELEATRVFLQSWTDRVSE